MRFSRLSLLFLPAALAWTDAHAQTLPPTVHWVIESESSNLGLHTEHGRPTGIPAFLSYPGLALDTLCVASHQNLLHYDITLTNTSSQEQSFSLGHINSVAWIGAGSSTVWPFCWQSADPHDTFWFVLDETLSAGASVQRSGSWVHPWSITERVMTPVSGAPCHNDGLHVDLPRVRTGPDFFVMWSVANTNIVVSDNNSPQFENLVTIRTEYDLPLIAGSNGCDPLLQNSTGQTGRLGAYGLADLSSGLTLLHAEGLPARHIGLFLVSDTLTPPTPLGTGTLCLGGNIHRWMASVGVVRSDGTFDVEVQNVPGGVTPGSTAHFQFYHRDSAAAGGRNTTNAVSVQFQ